MACSALSVKRSVYPSGAAFATSAPATLPPAPGRFSTVTGWPSCFDSSLAMARAVMSTPPPGGNGQTMRIGLEGNWACAANESTSSAVNTKKRRMCVMNMDYGPGLRFDNSFVRELPADTVLTNIPRRVSNASYTRVEPTPVAAPKLLAWSDEMGAKLGIERPAE